MAVINRFIQERRAGFKPDENELTPIQYEGVLIWDSVEAQYENAYKRALMQITGMFGAKK